MDFPFPLASDSQEMPVRPSSLNRSQSTSLWQVKFLEKTWQVKMVWVSIKLSHRKCSVGVYILVSLFSDLPLPCLLQAVVCLSIRPSIYLSIRLPGKVLDIPRQVNRVGQQIQYQVLFLSCKNFFWKRHAEIFTRVSFQFSMKLVTLPHHSTKNHSFLSLSYLSNFNTNH